MAVPNSYYRIHEIKNDYDDGISENSKVKYRTEYRRDYARVLHSPAFRRLENKTQLFPGGESDYFRNRLTHSLEVAQIAKSIAYKFKEENKECDFIEPDVCEVAGLIHDIGHPPFGHNGERALDDCMKECGGFEGNAQTIHTIVRLEKKEAPSDGKAFDKNGNDLRCGLNLTVRSIASGLKYDKCISVYRDPKTTLTKGYYQCDEEIIKKVKMSLAGSNPPHPFKTIECSIMDIADDIAYSTYDLEDAFKAGFLTPYKMMSASDELYKQIVNKLIDNGIETTISDCRGSIIELFSDVWRDQINYQKTINVDSPNYSIETVGNFIESFNLSEEFANNGYQRNYFSSYLVSRFISGLSIDIDHKYPILSKIKVEDEINKQINILKHFSYVFLINSSRLKVVENRGYDIISKMFLRLSSDEGYKLLPEDYQKLYFDASTDQGKKRVICDFIAGMTDRYAIEFYGRLFSENPKTIFKPL